MAEVFGFYLFAVNCGCSSLHSNGFQASLNIFLSSDNKYAFVKKMLVYYNHITYSNSNTIKKNFLVGTTELN